MIRRLMYKANETVPFVALNVLFTVVELLGLLAQQPFVKPEYVPYIVFVQAALNIVLKIWFTPQAAK